MFKDLYKDPTIDAIMSKRPTYIENAYNKNLRSPKNGRRRSQLPSDNHNSIPNIQEIAEVEQFLYSEKTDVTDLISVMNDLEKENDTSNEEDDDDDRVLNSDGGATKYQSYCYDLKIGPSSIVLKSLLTNTLSLSNYGLNSTGLLALATALKVIDLE